MERARDKNGRTCACLKKNSKTPRKPESFRGVLLQQVFPSLSVKRARAATPSLDSKDKSFESKKPQAFSPVLQLLLLLP